MAQVDYFLNLDGIKGESADDKHKGEIDIMSFSWGATNTGTNVSGGGGGAGKVSFEDIHITKTVDKSSPLLMLACASGQHIKSAVLACRKAGGEQQEYLKITLTDVLVSSYQSGGHGHDVAGNSSADNGQTFGPVPTDTISLNFAKITYEYKPQKPDGSLDSAVNAGWDIKANKKA